MTWPDGVALCTITLGPILNAGGVTAKLTARLTLDRTDRVIVHEESGTTILASHQPFTGESITFDVPLVDQAGFVGPDGAPITGWGYRLAVDASWGVGHVDELVKHFQPITGDEEIDLDQLEDGDFQSAVVGPTPTKVASVAGLAGVIAAEDLVDALLDLLPTGGGDAAELVAEHNADTTAVHGITDTALLETKTGAQSKANAAQAAAEATAAAALSAEATLRAAADAALTTSVNGKADSGHTHTLSEVTGLVAALAGKATAAQGAKADTAIQPAALEARIAELVDGAPGLLDTLGEIAAALADDDDAIAALTTSIAAKASQAALDTEAAIRAAADTALDGRLDAIEADYETSAESQARATAAQAAAEATAAAALGVHAADTTNQHGVADFALLETQAGAQAKADAAEADALAAVADLGDELTDLLGEETTARINADADLDDRILGIEGDYLRSTSDLAAAKLTGTIDDARIPAGITRDSELTAAIAAAVAGVIAAAPGALDTLDELAAALGDDASFATTVTNALAAKVAQVNGSARIVQGTTATAAGTAAKTATITGYIPAVGDLLFLTLTNGCSLGGVTLAINGGSAIPVYLGGAAVTSGTTALNGAGAVWPMIYDGSRWNLTGVPQSYTPASTGDMTAGTGTAIRLMTPANIKSAIDALTNRVLSTADTATLTIDASSYDRAKVTALAQAMTIAAPTGTPMAMQGLIIRIKDNGTARALTWTTGSSGAFRAIGVTLPTTTVVNKTVYVGAIWNSDADRWDVIAVSQEA